MRLFISVNQNTYTGDKGVYSKVTFAEHDFNHREFQSLLRQYQCPVSLATFEEEPHVTVMYSKKPISPVAAALLHHRFRKPAVFQARVQGVQFWRGHDNSGYLSLKLESPKLRKLHQAFRDVGAQPTYRDYSPHMTLAAGFGQLTVDLSKWMTDMNTELKQRNLVFTLGDLTVEALRD
jgi:hypothetical protein